MAKPELTQYYVFVVDSGFQYEDERPPEYFRFVEAITKRINAKDSLPRCIWIENPNPGREEDDLYIDVSRDEGPFATEAEGTAFGRGLLRGGGDYWDKDFVVIGYTPKVKGN